MDGICLHAPQLCLVTDADLPDLVSRVELALAAGITMLQLRGPHLTGRRLFDLASVLRPRCREYGVACIINDRLDVGLAVEADGYQLGGRSLPVAVARKLVSSRTLIGASVHSLEQSQRAVVNGADFLLAGTLFPSPSHPGEPVSGLGLLRTIKAAFPAIPLLGIGGITPLSASSVMAAGADGIAVVSAILRADDVTSAVKTLRGAIGLDKPDV